METVSSVSIPPAVLDYFNENADVAAKQTAVKDLCDLLNNQSITVLRLVLSLQQWLNSTDGSKRSAGTSLLSEVLTGSINVISVEDLHVLGEYLTARLGDWPCVEAAAKGCLQLLQLAGQDPQGKQLSTEGAVQIMRQLATAVEVQPLVQSGRQLCLQLWLAALQHYGFAAAKAGVDLFDGFIAAIDGEKDPRCLLLSFQVLKELARTFHARGVDPAPLQQNAQELVEILSCYFPITFTPPKNDPHCISRQQLEDALEECLAASPFLAEWAMPLVLEKLSSTYKPAKEDAMSALRRCCQGYGLDVMKGHLPAVWSAVRAEVMGPLSKGLSREELQPKQDLAKLALACLTDCIRALGSSSNSLDSLALADSFLLQAMTMVTSAHSSDARNADDDQRVSCAAGLLAAVAAASPACCYKVATTFIPHMLQPLQSGTEAAGSTGCLNNRTLYVFTVLSVVLNNVAIAWVQHGWYSPELLELVPSIIPVLHSVGGALLSPIGGQVADFVAQLQLLCSRVWSSILALHAALPAEAALPEPYLSANGLESAARHLISWALGPASASLDGAAATASAAAPAAVAVATAHMAIDSSTVDNSMAQQEIPSEIAARMDWGTRTNVQQEVLHTLVKLLNSPPAWSLDSGHAVHGAAAGSAGFSGFSRGAPAVVVSALQAALLQRPQTASQDVAAVTAAASPTAQSALAASAELCRSSQQLSFELVSRLVPVLLSMLQGTPALLQSTSAAPAETMALLSRLLPHVAQDLLPGWQQPLTEAQSIAAQHLTNQMLQVDFKYLCSSVTDIAAEGAATSAAITAACMSFVGLLVAKCWQQHQAAIALEASAMVTQLADQLQQLSSSQSSAASTQAGAPAPSTVMAASDGAAAAWQAAVACAALVGLQPGVLSVDSCSLLLEALLLLSSTGRFSGNLVPAVGLALGSILNKWQPPESLERAIEQVLDDGLLLHVNEARCLRAFAWVARGLAMRGHPALPRLISAVLAALMQAPTAQTPQKHLSPEAHQSISTPAGSAAVLGNGSMNGTSASAAASGAHPKQGSYDIVPDAANAMDSELADAVANFFEVLMSDSGNMGSLQLGRATHAIEKVLWRQHTFAMCLQQLLAALQAPGSQQQQQQDASAGHATSPTAAASPGTESAPARPSPALLFVFACLIKSVPPTLYLSEAARLPAIVLQAAASLTSSLTASAPSSQNQQRQCQALLGCIQVLSDAQLRPLLKDHVEQLLACLCAASCLPAAASIREAALQGLVQAMEMPYHLLHLHRHQVLKAVALALDDNKRSVRLLAAKARRVWSPR